MNQKENEMSLVMLLPRARALVIGLTAPTFVHLCISVSVCGIFGAEMKQYLQYRR